jgi:maltooligosyltrehalose synthase
MHQAVLCVPGSRCLRSLSAPNDSVYPYHGWIERVTAEYYAPNAAALRAQGIQFNRDLTFQKASEILEYLYRLGVTDIYASPLLESRSGSPHGYDVTDPTRINSDLGSEEQFQAFQSGLHLVKMTSPGVPDFYQGCELWDFRFVDPDNRGPVDFERRAALLREIETRTQQDTLRFCRVLVQNWHDGRIKLYLIWKILNLRRQHRQVFLEGQFLPLKASGK